MSEQDETRIAPAQAQAHWAVAETEANEAAYVAHNMTMIHHVHRTDFGTGFLAGVKFGIEKATREVSDNFADATRHLRDDRREAIMAQQAAERHVENMLRHVREAQASAATVSAWLMLTEAADSD